MERNLGEYEHSSTQCEILVYLHAHYLALRGRLLPQQRVQVSSHRFRIPDVCLLAPDARLQKIVKTPPVLCIEIMSPEDTMPRLMERLQDYLRVGVRMCWVIDPVSREAWTTATRGNLAQVTDGILRGEGIEMPLAEILPNEIITE